MPEESVNRYPIDFDNLKKGDVISTEELESIFGVDKDSPSFRLALLGLREETIRNLAARGRVWTVTCANSSLNVLTDSEAASYNNQDINRKVAGAFRSHYRQLHVDSGQLSQEEAKIHSRNLVVQGCRMAAIRGAKKEIKIQLERRKTPTLGGTVPDGGNGDS